MELLWILLVMEEVQRGKYGDDDFSFLLINSYTTGVSPTSLENILKMTFPHTNIDTGEIGLPIVENDLVLPCGIYGRITKD